MKFLLYSPDSFGLGHIRRTLAIGSRLREAFQDSTVRILTGAPRAHFFDYPQGADYVALPGITKNTAGDYVARDQDRSLDSILQLRGELIQHTLDTYRPDVWLVDHSPTGLCGELLPALASAAQQPQLFRVLGLRDVIDEPARVRDAWRADRIPEIIDRSYDQVVVYGTEQVLDVIEAYALPPSVASRVRYAGYIGRPTPFETPSELIKGLFAPRTGRLVLVTLGGGGDGDQLLRTFYRGMAGLGSRPDFETVVVTGPLMSPRKRRRFKEWSGRLARLVQLEFTPHLAELMSSADLVLSMAGYNTVCELASANANAVLVPRKHPRREQWYRAKRLAEFAAVTLVDPDTVTPELLVEEVALGLTRERPADHWQLSFSGLDGLVQLIRSRFERKGESHALDRQGLCH